MSGWPRWGPLALGALLFATVFAARAAVDSVAAGVTFLYVLPIIVVAFDRGLRGGIAAGVAAEALFAGWALGVSADMGAAAYGVRGVVFVAVGALTGVLSDALRATVRERGRYFELSRDMLCTARFDGHFVELNGSWQETLGWSREELMARPFLDFVHPDDRAQTEREAAALVGGRAASVSFSNRYRTKDGGWRWIEWTSRADRAQGLIYAAARDATERHSGEQAVREAEERFRRAFEDSPVGMATVAVDGEDTHRVLEANEALCRLLAERREDLIGKATLAEFAHPDEREALAAGMRRLAAGETPVVRAEIRVVRRDGRTVWVDLTTSIVRDDAGRALYRLSQLLDIDARKRAEQDLRELAEHDPLTGLYNRRRFDQELERELVRGARGAVLVIDLDGFKGVNDTYGHAEGDRLLAAVAEALATRLRGGDVVARVGGDEFAALLRRVDARDAAMVADDLIAAVTAALAAAGHAGTTSLSVGVAPFAGPGGADRRLDLVRAADAAMYAAKAAGGGRSAVAPPLPRAA